MKMASSRMSRHVVRWKVASVSDDIVVCISNCAPYAKDGRNRFPTTVGIFLRGITY
jgi:hypothetical protein